MIHKSIQAPQNLRNLTLRLNQGIGCEKRNDSTKYLGHLIQISKKSLKASLTSKNQHESLEIIGDLLNSEGFQYGEGKSFFKQLQKGKLDCELSALLYFILLDENIEKRHGDKSFTPSTFHKQDHSPHLAIKIERNNDSLWEATPGNERLVKESEYMNTFKSAIHHPVQEISHIPYANLLMNSSEITQIREALNRLDEIELKAFSYPSIDFYIDFIHHTLSDNGDEITKQDLTKLGKLINRISKVHRKLDSRISLIYINLAYSYEMLSDKRNASLYYLKAIRAFNGLPSSDLVNFSKAYSYMKLSSLAENKLYKQKSIRLFQQIQDESIFKEQAQINILNLLPT